MATIQENISQAIADFDEIKEAIEYKGVAVPDDSPTSEYGEKIKQIETGITPTGSIEIPNNGEYDVSEYAIASVDVQDSQKLINLIENDLDSFDVPEGTQTIARSMFSNRSNLQSVTLPSTLETIGTDAFYYCTGLTEISIPESVTTIESSAFYGCTNLATITFADTIETVENYAFDNTAWYAAQENGLIYIGKVAYKYKGKIPVDTHIELRSGTTAVSSYAFGQYDSSPENLRSITFAETVKQIGYAAFRGCTSLTEIILPAELISIDNYAFEYCRSLQEVSLPESIQYIKQGAFSSCESLLHVDIPNISTIESYTFSNCTALQDVLLPASVQTIENSAFSGCSNLEHIEIPETVTTLGSYVFQGCSSLATATLPSTLSSIPNALFSGCSSLQNIRIPESIKSVGSGAFSGCSNLTSIDLPDTVEYLGASAYNYCVKLTRVELPDNLSSCGDAVFTRCTSLSEIIFNSQITEISPSMFSYCSQLTTLNIPSSVIRIGTNAFTYCNALNQVHIAEGVQYIDSHAFSYCGTIVDLYLPASLQQIATFAFYYTSCTNLHISDVVSWCETIVGDNNYAHAINIYVADDLLEHLEIPDGTSLIHREAFSNCKSLLSASIGAETVEVGAFMGSSIETLACTDSVLHIANRAFYSCTDLTTAQLSNELQTLGDEAFNGCSNLTTISTLGKISEIARYTFYNCSSLQAIHIPDSVTTIREYAFRATSGLQTVTGGANVCAIEPYAFYGCASLQEFPFSESTSLESVGQFAFYGCSSLTQLSLPSTLSEITQSMFNSCTALTAVHIPSGIKKIERGAFYQCTSLSTIDVSDDVEYIGQEAFYNTAWLNSQPAVFVILGRVAYYNKYRKYSGTYTINWIGSNLVSVSPYACQNDDYLSAISFPSTMKFIGENSFYDCSNLTNVSIPEGVEEIGDTAFGYTKIIDVNLPSTITSVGSSAFCQNSNMYRATISSVNTHVAKNAFYNCSKLSTINVPEGWINVEGGAFDSTKWLNDQPDGVVYLGGTAYAHKGEIALGASIEIKPGTLSVVSEMLSRADYSYNVSTVILPESLIKIGAKAFYNLSNNFNTLVNNSKHLETIEHEAFYNCRQISNIYLPKSCSFIGYSAFYGCSNLRDVMYEGTEEEFLEITIQDGNSALTSARIHYNWE